MTPAPPSPLPNQERTSSHSSPTTGWMWQEPEEPGVIISRQQVRPVKKEEATGLIMEVDMLGSWGECAVGRVGVWTFWCFGG